MSRDDAPGGQFNGPPCCNRALVRFRGDPGYSCEVRVASKNDGTVMAGRRRNEQVQRTYRLSAPDALAAQPCCVHCDRFCDVQS